MGIDELKEVFEVPSPAIDIIGFECLYRRSSLPIYFTKEAAFDLVIDVEPEEGRIEIGLEETLGWD